MNESFYNYYQQLDHGGHSSFIRDSIKGLHQVFQGYSRIVASGFGHVKESFARLARIENNSPI